MSKLIWMPVVGFEKYYEVSNCSGLIRSIPRTIVRVDNKVVFKPGKLLSPGKNADGYLRVTLYKPGMSYKYKSLLVHRIVAEAFLARPNESGDLEVNHIDGNKYNNSVSNLEWLSPAENKALAKAERYYHVHAVDRICPTTGTVETYSSITAASRANGIRWPARIIRAAKSGRLMDGYLWSIAR